MSVRIYTDGSAKGNPGPGGYGIVLLSDEGHRKEVAKGFRKTTNNRMELLSVIIALEMLKSRPMDVVVYSDSKYVVDAVEKKWVFNWEKKYFDKKKKHGLSAMRHIVSFGCSENVHPIILSFTKGFFF